MTMKPISFWHRLLDLISPRLCVVCGQRLTVCEEIICSKCNLHLPRTGFQKDPYENEMAKLFWHQIPIERATALFYYEAHSETANILYELKYKNHPEIGEVMGRLMARELQTSGFFDGIDGIVPIPLARKRQRQRGYNQSMEIALGIKEVTELPIYNNVLKRIHFKASQTTMNAQQRKFNVEGAFALTNPGLIAHKHILLVDDIVTTGSTLIACGRELSKAPGTRISILTLGMTKT